MREGDVRVVAVMGHRTREGVEIKFVPKLVVAVERIQPALLASVLAEFDALAIHQSITGAAEQHPAIVADANAGIVEFEDTQCHASASLSGTCR